MNLRSLTVDEIGLPVARLPEGVHGFTTSAASSEVAAFDKPVFRSFEVHKLQDGEVRFLGYMTSADQQVFESGLEPATVDLYPDPYEEASNLVAVPVSRIDRKRPPLRDFGSPMKLELAPKL
jgi:hypothetical protein